MKKLIITIAAILSISSAVTLAHTGLKSTSPSANAMLIESPQVLTVEFNNEVRLVKLELKDKQSGSVSIPFEATAKADTVFSVSLPELDSGSYTVFWTILGLDGHKMKGDFSFKLHSSDDMNSMKNMKQNN